VQHDTEVFWAIEHHPGENICEVRLGKGSLKLWPRVESSSHWDNCANPHFPYAGKSCLDLSVELISILLICLCAVREVGMCMDHVQAPAKAVNTVGQLNSSCPDALAD